MKIKDWGNGLNKDQPAWELAPGFWTSATNMRFRNGKAEMVGGIASVITPSVTPYAVIAYSSGATRYVAYAGTTKAYVHDGSSETEITRIGTGSAKTVTALVQSGTTVTVTTGTNHGLTASVSSVTLYGLKDSLRINGTYTVATTPTATTFTVTVTRSDNYTATANHLTSIGYYVGGGSVTNFTGAVDDKITWDNFNGVLIYNNPVDGLYFYDQASSGRLVQLGSFSSYKADVVRKYKYYLVALAPTISSVKYRHQVMWSAAAEAGDVPLYFTSASTNDAGAVDVVSDGECVDGVSWGEDFIIYKRDSRFRMRYIGGNSVFDFEQISGNHKDDGLLAANCVVNTPKGQVFLTDGHDIRIHAGGESQSIAAGRVLDYLRGAIDSTYRKRAFLCVNPKKTEVQVWFPESGQTSCTKALTWNWESDTWGEITQTGITAGSAGEYPSTIAPDASLLLCNTTPRIGLCDSGTTRFGSSYTWSLERVGMDFDDPSFKMVSKTMPLFEGSSAFTASIYHGAGATQDATPTYGSAITYTHNTTRWCNGFSTSGPYLAWKATGTASDTSLSLRSIDFDIKVQGGY